ncbi:MAG TPA: DUF4349 domain-containing protein [Candidatus Limnocylindrales bacterium]|nr:DUF4349 domain-containing protein [Candidatus Limnocylindrales bacterium]
MSISNRAPKAARLRVLFVLIAVSAMVAACSGSAAILSNVGNSVGGEGLGQAPAGPSTAGNDYQGATGAPGIGTGSTGGGGNGSGTGNGGNPQQAPVDGAKIVKTGSMSVQVADLDAAVAKAHDAIVAMGGYVGQSRQTNDGDRPTATVAYRIPADRWDAALGSFRGLATKVVSEQTDAVEVTGQLIDLNARIDNLRASEKALQSILEKATKVQDILDVEARLSDVRGQIEQLDAQRAHLADQAALGTLSVTYSLPIVAVTEAAKGWDPGAEVDRATASLVDLLQAGAGAGIWFGIVWIPVLLFLGIVIAIILFVVRRLGITRPPSPPDVVPGDAA